MESLAAVHEQVRQRISLRGFMRLVGQPYWRLRDYLRGCRRRADRHRRQAQAIEEVKAAAAQEATYGYRRVYQHLRDQGLNIGREWIRRCMGPLGLQPPPPRKRQRAKYKVIDAGQWPAGRRLQIDATRLVFEDGITWVYLVEDVKTRLCLAASAGASLSQQRAAQTLLEGHRHLQALGLDGPRLVQSDGGSDFTSTHFQQVCAHLGSWVRCRVAQVGGMGILERLNRTFKHEFVFRQELNTRQELEGQLPAFQQWYNDRRLHSRLGYRTPRSVLAAEAAETLA